MALVTSHLRRRQKIRRVRQNFDLYASLVAVPADLGSGFALPASGTLWVSTSSVLAAVTTLVTCGERELNAPALAANRAWRLGFFERGVTVQVAAGAPGTVRVYVEDPARVPTLIAEGTA